MAMHKISVTINGAVRERKSSRAFCSCTLSAKCSDDGHARGLRYEPLRACTVHLDGEPVKSCTVLAVQADGAKITTVEGLEQGGKLHAVQEGFTEKHGLQCGFCTPGMLMTTSALLVRNKIRASRNPRGYLRNLCRCTGYVISSRP